MSDALEPLTTTWQAIKTDPHAILKCLDEWTFDKQTYDGLKREKFESDSQRAAQFLYLNRGAYGGLWRVNRAGEFNVPWSTPKTLSPIDHQNILAVSQLLNSTEVDVRCADFAETTRDARPGDFVFFDPPYSKSQPKRPFIHYNEKLFDWEQQVRLAVEAERLRQIGVKVIVTNSTHPEIEVLYPQFHSKDLRRHSSLGSLPTRSMHLTERVFVSM